MGPACRARPPSPPSGACCRGLSAGIPRVRSAALRSPGALCRRPHPGAEKTQSPDNILQEFRLAALESAPVRPTPSCPPTDVPPARCRLPVSSSTPVDAVPAVAERLNLAAHGRAEVEILDGLRRRQAQRAAGRGSRWPWGSGSPRYGRRPPNKGRWAGRPDSAGSRGTCSRSSWAARPARPGPAWPARQTAAPLCRCRMLSPSGGWKPEPRSVQCRAASMNAPCQIMAMVMSLASKARLPFSG